VIATASPARSCRSSDMVAVASSTSCCRVSAASWRAHGRRHLCCLQLLQQLMVLLGLACSSLKLYPAAPHTLQQLAAQALCLGCCFRCKEPVPALMLPGSSQYRHQLLLFSLRDRQLALQVLQLLLLMRRGGCQQDISRRHKTTTVGTKQAQGAGQQSQHVICIYLPLVAILPL